MQSRARSTHGTRVRVAGIGAALVAALLPHALGSPAAALTPGDITLASTSDAGVKGNAASPLVSLSDAGTKVAFESFATNLDPGDTDGIGDAYVKDLTTGDVTLASTSDAGVKGDGESTSVSLSGDGTKVAFQAFATNLDPADTDAVGDVYVKDLTTGDIALASTSDAGIKGNGASGAPSMSTDGTKLSFQSSATNLDPADTDTANDIYVKDLTTGDIALASTSDAGVKANFASFSSSLSGDGTRVAFHAFASNLDPADPDAELDSFVKDVPTGDLILVSITAGGFKGPFRSGFPAISDDGTAVVFNSANRLDPADIDRLSDIYVKDLTTGALTLASTSDTGVKSNRSNLLPSISADGSIVAFGSFATNLDPADPKKKADIYVKDLTTGDIALASASDTGVKGNNESGVIPSLSADGFIVAFVAMSTNLDPADHDTLADIYVKVVGP